MKTFYAEPSTKGSLSMFEAHMSQGTKSVTTFKSIQNCIQ